MNKLFSILYIVCFFDPSRFDMGYLLRRDATILIDSGYVVTVELIYNTAIESKSQLLTTVCHRLHAGKLCY